MASKEAGAHMGEIGWVLCPVVGAEYVPGLPGEPTFLDCDEAYPNHTMSVIIWGEHREEFPSSPEEYYRGKEICVEVLLWSFGGKPSITVWDGAQITVVGEWEGARDFCDGWYGGSGVGFAV